MANPLNSQGFQSGGNQKPANAKPQSRAPLAHPLDAIFGPKFRLRTNIEIHR